MFEFYNECSYQYYGASSSSIITPIAQSVSALVALVALIVAWKNLTGLKRTQSLQAQMNLISLENEVRKNYLSLKMDNLKYIEETTKKGSTLVKLFELQKINSFELYLTTADKLAALINSKFLKGQFEKRKWKDEYSTLFIQAKEIHTGEDSIIPGKNQMINNIEILLQKWQKN